MQLKIIDSTPNPINCSCKSENKTNALAKKPGKGGMPAIENKTITRLLASAGFSFIRLTISVR